MASRTQLRLGQITGSFREEAGQITDSRAASGAASLDLITIQSGSMVGVLSEIVSALKRTHGADTFAKNAAGTFYQNLLPGTDDTYDLGSASAACQDLHFYPTEASPQQEHK